MLRLAALLTLLITLTACEMADPVAEGVEEIGSGAEAVEVGA